MDFEQIKADVKRGWDAPMMLVIAATLMTVPATMVVFVLVGGVLGLGSGAATAFGAVFQIVFTFWLAGFRLRRRGEQKAPQSER